MSGKRCEGYTLSGQQCRKRPQEGQRYCSLHCRAAEIGLPPYITVTPEQSFWIYMPIGRPNWSVGGSAANLILRCPTNGGEYLVDRYVSEGSYGAVYFGVQKNSKRRVALKIFKEVYRSKRKSVAESDFIKEFFVNAAVKDRVGNNNTIATVVDAFFIKTTEGFHGCLVMEKMDGDLCDLFDNKLNGLKNANVLRFWLFSCNFMANALLELHTNDIYHLDIKSGNVLWKKQQSNERGVVLKLIDFGLGCYMRHKGCEPAIPCEATGTHLPIEWRRNGSKKTPTYERLSDPRDIRGGEAYALCVTCRKMLKKVNPAIYIRFEHLKDFIELINRGSEGRKGAVSIRAVEEVSRELLEEMDAASTDKSFDSILS